MSTESVLPSDKMVGLHKFTETCGKRPPRFGMPFCAPLPTLSLGQSRPCKLFLMGPCSSHHGVSLWDRLTGVVSPRRTPVTHAHEPKSATKPGGEASAPAGCPLQPITPPHQKKPHFPPCLTCSALSPSRRLPVGFEPGEDRLGVSFP